MRLRRPLDLASSAQLGAHPFRSARPRVSRGLHGLGELLVGFLLRRGELFAKPTGRRRAAPVLRLRDHVLDLGRIEASLALILGLDLARLPLGASLGEPVRGLLRSALGLLGTALSLARAPLSLAQATLDRLELAGGLVLGPLEVLLEGEDLVDRPLLGALGGAPRGEPDPFGDVVVGSGRQLVGLGGDLGMREITMTSESRPFLGLGSPGSNGGSSDPIGPPVASSVSRLTC